MAAGDQYSHTVLGNGHLVIVKADTETWGDDGRMVDPPKMFVLYYDMHRETAVAEPISFEAAAALVPDKHAAITKELGLSRYPVAVNPTVVIQRKWAITDIKWVDAGPPEAA